MTDSFPRPTEDPRLIDPVSANIDDLTDDITEGSIDALPTREDFSNTRSKNPRFFSPGGQVQGRQKDFSYPRSKNPRLFSPGGRAQSRICFPGGRLKK